MHPVQSPPSSSPISREFIPGPFSIPRLKETYHTNLASDIMTLTYVHKLPGEREEPIGERRRSWDGSSPYHKNRPLKQPRGKRGLRPVERDINFNNIPEVREVTVATFVPQGIKSPDLLVVARMALQTITGVVPMGTKARTDVAQWKIKTGQWAGYKATMYGDRAYEFLDRCIHHVLPRIKEWKGVSGMSSSPMV
jgi:large subunit ribosomal protein L5